MTTLQLFTDIEAPANDTAHPTTVDKKLYREKCGERWHTWALKDALGNWHTWLEIHDKLETAMRTFLVNPQLEDLAGMVHNTDGTLTNFLWKLQSTIEPNQSCLYPLLDFEESCQRLFLKRGLVIYCSLILEALEQ